MFRELIARIALWRMLRNALAGERWGRVRRWARGQETTSWPRT